MKKTARFLLLLVLFSLSASPLTAAEKTEDEKKIFIVSPVVSYFFPSSGKTKDAFGSSWGGFGVALNPEVLGWNMPDLEVKAAGMKFVPYFGYSHASEGDNDAYLIPVGLATSWTMKEGKHYRFSLGAGLSLVGAKVEVPSEGIDSGWKCAVGGRVMIGYQLAKWLEVTAGYNLMTEVEDYNFNGFTIGAKINFYF